MFKRILLVILWCLIPISFHYDYELPEKKDAQHTLTERLWEETCDIIAEEYEYSCIGVEPPEVRFEATQGDGWYGGDGIVHVNWDLTGYAMSATVVHEMVHHVHSALDRYEIPGFAASICMSEDEAFHVMNVWLVNKNLRPLFAWYQYYETCWQFFVNMEK